MVRFLRATVTRFIASVSFQAISSSFGMVIICRGKSNQIIFKAYTVYTVISSRQVSFFLSEKSVKRIRDLGISRSKTFILLLCHQQQHIQNSTIKGYKRIELSTIYLQESIHSTLLNDLQSYSTVHRFRHYIGPEQTNSIQTYK